MNNATPAHDVLILCHRFPYPPNKGDRIRSCNIIKYLCQNGWRIHLATLLDSPGDADNIEALRPYCASLCAEYLPKWRRMATLWRAVGGTSLSVEYFRNSRLQQYVNAVLAAGRIAAAVAVSAPMAEYLRRTPGPRPRRMVLDLVDVDSEKWRAYAARERRPLGWPHALESRMLARYEEKAGALFGCVTLVSEAEADLLRPRAAGRFSVKSVSNGVDAAYFTAGSEEDVASPETMIFCGAMDYPPNVEAVVWFAEEVLPLVQKRCPGARFCIAGSHPVARVRALGDRPGIQVTGTVADIRPLVRAATLSVAPMRLARGVQNKVLEAMAMGKAVVVTPEALEGIEAVPGQDVAVASDDPQAFAATVIRLLADTSRRQAMGVRAREWVASRYSWETCLEPLARLLV